jgi:hypothetical protein
VSFPKHFDFGTELFEFICELDFVYKANCVDIFVVLVDDLNVCAGQAIDRQFQIGVVLSLNEVIARRLREAFSLCFLDVYLFINTLFLDSFLQFNFLLQPFQYVCVVLDILSSKRSVFLE